MQSPAILSAAGGSPEEQIAFTTEALINCLRSSALRLLRAGASRKEAATTTNVDNYRLVWLRSGVNSIINTLEILGRDFNARNPDDICTLHDFQDILLNALQLLDHQSKEA